tara:strand:- start:1726 stop:2013 length:288 start_codon:yes stop_codon:yes gene_type:complete
MTDEIKLYYEGTYIDEEDNEEHDVKGFSIVSKDAYITFWHETMYEPCRCNVQGCLSCFLEETNGYADGFGANVSILWFGTDENGNQWNYNGSDEE